MNSLIYYNVVLLYPLDVSQHVVPGGNFTGPCYVEVVFNFGRKFNGCLNTWIAKEEQLFMERFH